VSEKGKYGSSQSRLAESGEDNSVAAESEACWNSGKDVVNKPSLEGISKAGDTEQKLKGLSTRSINRSQCDHDDKKHWVTCL